MSGYCVWVYGVPKYLRKEDLVIYFQSNKKSNGGDIAKIDFDPERGEAKILFTKPSDAKKVLSKPMHEFKGALLTVVGEMEYRKKASQRKRYEEELEEPEEREEREEPECASVMVSGLSSKTTKDAIQMYFENSRRSSGGDVESVRLDGNQAVVTFESPDVAKKVLEWGKHTLDECPLTVSRPTQHKNTPNDEEYTEQPLPRSRMVRVLGISDNTTKDALLNFFENTRRSGGGEIEDIQHIPDEGLADITFCSPEVAELVSQKEGLELDGSKLTVTLKEIPKEIPKDPNKLHVIGISVKTTKDGLTSFMEVVSGEAVESMLFGSNYNAMITFKEPPDLDKAQKKCSTRALDGSHLKIEQVNICDCIEVSGLAPNTTKDTVYYYFDNPRNGGGEVKRVEMDLEKKARAIVFFEDPKVLNNVTKGRHTINGAQLKVVPYYPFLGETSTSPDEKKEKVVKVFAQSIAFINKFFCQEFYQLLQEIRIKYTWQQGSGEIVLGCVESKMDKTSWEHSCQAVVSYVNQIVTEKSTVSKEAYKVVLYKAKEIFAPFKDQVDVICIENKCLFTLTGKKTDVDALAEQLNDLKSETEKQIQFDKNKTSKSISISEAQIELLSFSGFVDGLQAEFKDLEVTISKKDLKINFTGTDAVVKEGNIRVWQALSKVKEAEMEIPKSLVGIVTSEAGRGFMLTKFKKENINAVLNVDPNSDTQLIVTALDRTDNKKAKDIIKDITSEQSINVDANQKQLLHTEKWKEIKHFIHQSKLLQVTEELASSTLWIAGIRDEVDRATEQIEAFFEENIILDKEVETESGRVKFIFKYKIDAIKDIEKTLRNQTVKVTKSEEEYESNALVVSGTRDGLKQAIREVQKLIDNVKDRRVNLDKPGMKKFFTKKKGITLLFVVENDHTCIIERCTPSLDTKLHVRESLSKILYSYVTPEGKKIALYKGDLTEHRVDVMVNAANDELKHVGGLAKSIVVKGGKEIQDECNGFILRNGKLLDGEVFVSKPGKLPCKRLVHAVGPRWNSAGYHQTRFGNEEMKARILGQTVYNSLQEADRFTSIALPAISAGVFGCPVDVCAKISIESALDYSKENSNSKLTEIDFVDMNDSAIKAFHTEMTTRFGRNHSFTNDASPKGNARKEGKSKGTGIPKRRARVKESVENEQPTLIGAEDSGAYDDPNSFTTPQGMKLLIIVGDLAKEEAHAIVNTVSSDLDLNKNLCAKALSDAAGPGLQQECKSKGSLAAGQLLVSDGYNLGCKNVFHVVAGSWQNGQGEPVLRSLIQSCLKEADKREFSSIAFPAIGTGNLAFPRDVVAKAFFEEADAFKSTHPQSPLNEVHLVLFHKDKPTVQAFQDELKNRKPKVKTKRRSHVFKSEDIDEFASKIPLDSVVNISEDLSSSSYIGSVRLEIVPGDITKEKTDAIVTVSNPSLNVSFGGGVGTAIAKAGGPTIQNECNKLGPQKPGSVVSTSAGLLPSKTIFHLALVSSSFVSKDISDVIVQCLSKAESMRIKSIAVPAIGTGMGGINPKDAAKALLSAIAKFSQENPFSVNHIRIVVFQEDMLETFYGAIEDLSKSKSGMLASLWERFKYMIGLGESGTPYSQSFESATEVTRNGSFSSAISSRDEPMWLQVFASCDKHLDRAENDIHKLINEYSKTKDITRKEIGKLSNAQRNKVMRLETKHDTKIQIDEKIDRIVIRGASEDVSDATLAVYDILNERSEEEHTRRFAELLSKNVQWYYMDGSDEDPYDEETNAKIEQAYQDNQRDVVVMMTTGHDNKLIRYKIDFSAMKERNLDNNDTTRVERKEATSGISLPTHWDPQPKDAKGKELDVHLVVLDPTNHKKEYDQVKTAVEKTNPINIVKIERVQNPTLYKTYAVKKQKMDDGKGSNEKKLFHGTAPATCDLINHQGFNRSYCGKNATAFGKGVYFAVSASYSMQSTYSPPDLVTGRRCMYMASVLAGEFTPGNSSMVAPPPKDPNMPTITFDTVVNNVSTPEIYVVFHDTQNYPDYLITFK